MTVHLVGVGPGDPELLTLKAARLLSSADAVVYDRLIGEGVLSCAPPSAERYSVGKSPGVNGPSQDEINSLLIALGHRLTTVVRVKGGDPFLFGRGIEELAATMMAGIPTEVVPGITSALSGPLAAGVSVTGRGFSSGVCVVTAQQDPASDPVDWQAVARSGLTIVVLMGARLAAEVRELLLSGGRRRDTPVAVVTNATRPDQHQWFGTLDQLGMDPVAAPSVLVIGTAVGHRADVDDSIGLIAGIPASRPR